VAKLPPPSIRARLDEMLLINKKAYDFNTKTRKNSANISSSYLYYFSFAATNK